MKEIMWVGDIAATNWDTVGCRYSEITQGSGEGKYQTNGRHHRPCCLDSHGDRRRRVIACGDGFERTECLGDQQQRG